MKIPNRDDKFFGVAKFDNGATVIGDGDRTFGDVLDVYANGANQLAALDDYGRIADCDWHIGGYGYFELECFHLLLATTGTYLGEKSKLALARHYQRRGADYSADARWCYYHTYFDDWAEAANAAKKCYARAREYMGVGV